MRVAIEGCAHGELESIYDTVAALEKENNFKVDLLICCGDFQAVRNVSDLKCMAVPDKYLQMNTFYKYYSGEKTAPVLTIFIGGNHEASNYLSELAYGGWVAPNIYFLGHAGVVKFGHIRIGGLSGIYKGYDYLKGRHEYPPYNQYSKKTVYHIRNIDVFRLKQVLGKIDICISHDWPRGVHQYGDVQSLLRTKQYFLQDIQENKLGSRPTEDLLHKLQPTYWFSAHLHVKFAALIRHPQPDNEDAPPKCTKFLSLDKCLPRKKFLQIINLEPENSSGETSSAESEKPVLKYDRHWLCILKSTNHLFSVRDQTVHMPGPGCSERFNFEPTEEELNEMDTVFENDYKIPINFVKTSDAYTESPNGRLNLFSASLAQPQINPQTTEFCRKLSIKDPMVMVMEANGLETSTLSPADTSQQRDCEWTFVDESERDVTLTADNPNEISVDSDDELVEEKSIENDTVKRISDEDGPPSSEIKKFKRRNHSIYASTEDDGQSDVTNEVVPE